MCVCVCVQCTSLHYMMMHFSISFNRFHIFIVDVATIIHYKCGQYYVKYVHKYCPYHVIPYFNIFQNNFHLFLLQGTYWGLNHVTTFFKWVRLNVLLQFWPINLWTLWSHDSLRTHLFFFTCSFHWLILNIELTPFSISYMAFIIYRILHSIHLLT